MKHRDTFDYFMSGSIIAFGFLLIYCFLFITVHVGNEVECLEKGYPEVRTTWNLKGYCVNIDGAVTGVVEELE